MAMRSVIPRALTREVQGIPRSAVSGLVRRLSDGRVFSEEERAAENVYIKKMEKERQEKKKLQADKEKAEKDKADKKAEGQTHNG